MSGSLLTMGVMVPVPEAPPFWLPALPPPDWLPVLPVPPPD
jgi:hypothetical protein